MCLHKIFYSILQCNNPLTKEAKLTAAKRIVPEWTDYDNEIKVLWDEIYKNGSSKDKQTTQSDKGKF